MKILSLLLDEDFDSPILRTRCRGDIYFNIGNSVSVITPGTVLTAASSTAFSKNTDGSTVFMYLWKSNETNTISILDILSRDHPFWKSADVIDVLFLHFPKQLEIERYIHILCETIYKG